MKTLADRKRLATLVQQWAEAIEARLQQEARGEWALVGIRSRGDLLAERLAHHIGPQHFAGRVGVLDITLYRDDLSEIANQPEVRTTEIDFPIDGLDVVLVDDVLMTGRSIRAALQVLMDFGRPRRVWLAVLVDRGGRELPIAADFVALDLSQQGLDAAEQVRVQLTPLDEQDAIALQRKEPAREQ